MKIYRANHDCPDFVHVVSWHTSKNEAWKATKETRAAARRAGHLYGPESYVVCYDFPTTKKELVEFLNSRDIFKTDNG